MNVYIICVNDSLEFATASEDRAKVKLQELKELYYKKNQYSFQDRESYERRCYWHIHVVEGEV